MPYWREGDPKPAWLLRREWRNRLCLRLFGHDSETMLGVAAIASGGILGGMCLVSIIRDGWDFEKASGAVIFLTLGVWFGLLFIPERRGD